jgi:hypothetical protein
MPDFSDRESRSRLDLLLAEAKCDNTTLEAALESSDPTHRALALGSLDRLGALSDAMMTSALIDEAALVRCRGLEITARRPDIDIAELLSDPDDLVVETAAWALGEREDAADRIVDALRVVAIEHEVSICREAAVAALGALGSPRGLDAILHGMSDRATVRRRAVLALAPFDGPEVRETLTLALDDRDRQVRQAAEDLL